MIISNIAKHLTRASLREFEQKIRSQGVLVFTIDDIVRIFGWSRTAVSFLLFRYTKRGYVKRLRKGLYVLSNASVPEQYIANRLHEPSYVSLESALSFHGVILETVYAVTSMTAKRSHSVKALGRDFSYHHLVRGMFTGYRPVTQGTCTFLMADPEKALIDHCYLVVHGVRSRLDTSRMRLDDMRLDKIEEYARLTKDVRVRVLVDDLMKHRENPPTL